MLIIVVTLFVLLLITGIVLKVKEYNQSSEIIKKLPKFSFLTLDNEVFNSKDIVEGPVLVIHFHPECGQCKYEISDMLKSEIPSLECLVLMISSANADSLKSFYSMMDLYRYPSVILLKDTALQFGEIFGSDFVPANYIYNKSLVLLKTLHGEYKIETISKYLKEYE